MKARSTWTMRVLVLVLTMVLMMGLVQGVAYGDSDGLAPAKGQEGYSAVLRFNPMTMRAAVYAITQVKYEPSLRLPPYGVGDQPIPYGVRDEQTPYGIPDEQVPYGTPRLK